MKWLRATFSDGGKPSLSRQLLTLSVLVDVYLALTGKPIPQPFADVTLGLCGWAGWSRYSVIKGNQVEETDEPA